MVKIIRGPEEDNRKVVLEKCYVCGARYDTNKMAHYWINGRHIILCKKHDIRRKK